MEKKCHEFRELRCANPRRNHSKSTPVKLCEGTNEVRTKNKHRRKTQLIDRRSAGWTKERTNAGMGGQKNGHMLGWVDGWKKMTESRVDGWTDENKRRWDG